MLTEPFTDIDDCILTDLEDSAFKLGVNTGLASEFDPAKAFITITQQFLEFGIPEISYSALAFLNPEKNILTVFSPYHSFNYKEQSLTLLQRDPLKGLDLLAEEMPSDPLNPVPGELSVLSSYIEIPIRFQSDSHGSIFILSSAPYGGIWKSRNIDRVLLNLYQIILKVGHLVYASETSMFSLINQIDDGIILMNFDRHIKFINYAAKTLLGLSEQVDDNVKQFITAIFTPLLNELGEQKDRVSKEFDLKYPVERTLNLTVLPLKDKNHLLIIIKDISHYKEVDRIKTEIISTVSHELRTPLTAIDSMVKNLLRGIAGDLPEKVLSYLDRIKNNTSRLSNLINNLLDLSKLEAGEVFIRRKFDNLPELIGRVQQGLEEKFRNKGIDFSIDISPQIVNVFVDAAKLDQVLMNLVGNSVKFVEEKGKIRVSAIPKENEILLSVLDDGPGIPLPDQDKIFKKFKQLGREYGAGEKGTGLGLAICLEIIKLHHGKIQLYSPPENTCLSQKGSEFRIYLPAFDEEKAFIETVKDVARENAKDGKNIALVKLLFKGGKNGREILDLGPDTNKNIVKLISDLIKKNMDEVIYLSNKRQIYIILISNSDGVKIVLKRLKKEIQQLLKRLPAPTGEEKIKILFRQKMFPEDSDHIESLAGAILEES